MSPISLPTATNLKVEDADGTRYSATISGQTWSGISSASRFWPSIQAAIADGAPIAPYVQPAEPTPRELRAARYRSEADPLLLAVYGYQIEVEAGINGAATKRDQAKADYLAAKLKIRNELPD